jgi:hypothetical protein|tara:strand:+ start:22092 stop:22238 length:147 start_codon:yes stop_codon:yes gene_type:complete
VDDTSHRIVPIIKNHEGFSLLLGRGSEVTFLPGIMGAVKDKSLLLGRF